MKKLLSTLLIICHTSFCLAQIDSLKQCLLNANGKEKLKILNKLTALDTTENFRNYHRQATALAKEINDDTSEVRALRAMGNHYLNSGQTDSAYLYFTKALIVARKYKLPSEIIVCLNKSADAQEEAGHFDKALQLYTEALYESKKINKKKEIAVAYENLGIFHLYQRNDSTALKCFNEQLKLLEQLNDSSTMYICLNNIGSIYLIRGEYSNCIQYYLQSIGIEKRLKKDDAVAQSHVNIGIVYKTQGNLDMALESLLEAVRYFDKQKPSTDRAKCYTAIGNILIALDSTKRALLYHYKSLEINEKINYKKGIAKSYTNIAETYMKLAQYDSALIYITYSIKLKETLKDKASLAYSFDILGENYFHQKDYAQAQNYYLQSMKLQQEVEDPNGKATTLNKLGALYFEWGKYDLALKNLEEAREIELQIGAKQLLLNNYRITRNALKENKDFLNALYFSDKYIELNEDMLNEQKNNMITNLQLKYDTEKKEQEIKLLTEKDKSHAAIVSQQYTLITSLIAGAFLLIIILLISLKAYRTSEKSNKQKQVMMKELHHRVTNNLQVLSSLLNLQQNRLEDVATKDAIKEVQHRLKAMLLIHRDLYSGSADAYVDMKIYIEKLVDNLLSSFGYSKSKMKINLVTDHILLEADKALNVGFICNEVVNNSFKHAFSKTDQPELTITLQKQGTEYLLFAIADNGKGMQIEKDIEKTNSFGLRLINMFIKDLKGSLNIASNENGSRFEFIIPTNNLNT
ncbi:MAG: tetratricopeptide repeat protein [Bacteroidia bacterium]